MPLASSDGKNEILKLMETCSNFTFMASIKIGATHFVKNHNKDNKNRWRSLRWLPPRPVGASEVLGDERTDWGRRLFWLSDPPCVFFINNNFNKVISPDFWLIDFWRSNFWPPSSCFQSYKIWPVDEENSGEASDLQDGPDEDDVREVELKHFHQNIVQREKKSRKNGKNYSEKQIIPSNHWLAHFCENFKTKVNHSKIYFLSCRYDEICLLKFMLGRVEALLVEKINFIQKMLLINNNKISVGYLVLRILKLAIVDADAEHFYLLVDLTIASVLH